MFASVACDENNFISKMNMFSYFSQLIFNSEDIQAKVIVFTHGKKHWMEFLKLKIVL